MLTIYKASAGSGKTFRLVIEYLKLVLSGDYNYRHILAVTFTNKATAEMKERILDQLGNMAGNNKSQYLETLIQETGQSEYELRMKAKRVLKSLLFDYDHFSVSTIDKFTQKVLKAFNREIGVNPDYLIELDSDLLISEAIDRMISSVGINDRLRLWLESFVEEKIRNSENFTIENDLKKLGKELFKEKLQENIRLLSNFFEEKESDREYLKMLDSIIFSFKQSLVKFARELVAEYTNAGFCADDFSYKKKGVAGSLEKISNGEIPDTLVTSIQKAADGPEGWVTGSNLKNKEIVGLANEKLIPGLRRMKDYFDANSKNFFTAKVIISQWYTLAVLMDINSEIAALGREKGILPIAGSNLLLKAIIDGNDTPFVYEKIGNIYQHYLLDEFQDTSEMQWENFRPLISNSLATGNSNFVVGDVKQSIYRWRNSNWNILDHRVFNDLKNFKILEVQLDSNFRSSEEIVKFNNHFFKRFAKSISRLDKLQPASQKYESIIGQIYSDPEQLTATKSEGKGGIVRIDQLDCDEEKFMDISLRRLGEQVKELYNNGYKPKDIAILVRKNEQGVRVVRYFMEIANLPENKNVNLKIISGESLYLRTSVAINFIICLLRYLTGKEDLLIKANLLHLYKSFIVHNISDLNSEEHSGHSISSNQVPGRDTEQRFALELGSFISNIKNEIAISSIDEMIIRICALFQLFDMDQELPFLQTLIDKASEIKKNGTADISGFLQWWDEKGQDVAISTCEETEAIRLLTIHKAKGLQFQAVLIPFLDWKLIERPDNIIWCEPTVSPFNLVPLLPVHFTEKLTNTIFSDDYYHELFNVLVDNLNLVYVAFTRSKSALIVNTPARNDRGRIGTYLSQAITELSIMPIFENSWNGESKTFTFGSIPVFTSAEDKTKKGPELKWIFNDFSDRLRIRTDSEDYLHLAERGRSGKNLGKIIHAILSEIKTTDSIESACSRAMATYSLLPGEMDPIIRQIRRMTDHSLAREWFTGKWSVVTEADLLTPQNTFRPDRIMLSGNTAHVVDFKTGMRKEESHFRQVRKYMEILKETGFGEVKGYLWYIHDNQLVEVTE